jgi:hypothetical protein
MQKRIKHCKKDKKFKYYLSNFIDYNTNIIVQFN